MNALSNKRHPNESQDNYRARRTLVEKQLCRYLEGRALNEYLKGRMLHVSTQIVQIPAKGVDSKIDEAVLRGEYRDLQTVFQPGAITRTDLPNMPSEPYIQEQRRGRTKGTTLRRYAVGYDRKYCRALPNRGRA
jgi:hypothetical protein